MRIARRALCVILTASTTIALQAACSQVPPDAANSPAVSAPETDWDAPTSPYPLSATVVPQAAASASASAAPTMAVPTPASAQVKQPLAATQPAVVRIDNFNFMPKELTVAVGTTVTWQNADDVPHTATSKDDPQTFDSGPLDTDDKFSFTFSKSGTYAYYCKVHPHMTGVVIVK
jgi:plastocyanin